MKGIRAMQSDRRRSQQGSVLSGVLIITAFLAIISAALMTTLSTNLLISRTLVHRVINEATVNSAVELTIDQVQAVAIGQPCPSPSSAIINGITASASLATCETTSDSGPAAVAGSSAFTTDGTHVVIGSGWNVNEYLVGDAGSLYEVNFGSGFASWSYSVGGPLTGPPNAVIDSTGAPNLLDLVPTSGKCGGAPYCVQLLTESAGLAPTFACSLPAGAAVTARPATGLQGQNRKVAFFGDAEGNLFAYDVGNVGDSDCTVIASPAVQDGLPVVAGPFVFPGPSGTDEVYVVASDGGAAEVVRYAYSGGPSGSFSSPTTVDLPFGGVSGVGVDGTTLPARLAISYSGGQVSLAQISASYAISILGSTSVPTGISDAPGWCQCPGGSLIGIGGQNGTLYVLDTSLNLHSSFGGPSSITTSPAADAAGDWFYGASNRYLYEAALPPGQAAMVQEGAFGPVDGAAGSSAISGACPNGICVYFATTNRHAYLTTFDARDVVVTACISTAPPTCSGDNPRLWASAQIGTIGAPRSVRITGWSYYSP